MPKRRFQCCMMIAEGYEFIETDFYFEKYERTLFLVYLVAAPTSAPPALVRGERGVRAHGAAAGVGVEAVRRRHHPPTVQYNTVQYSIV